MTEPLLKNVEDGHGEHDFNYAERINVISIPVKTAGTAENAVKKHSHSSHRVWPESKASNEYADPSNEVDSRAKKYSEEHGVSYAEAVKAVVLEDPELGEAYLNCDY